MYLIRYIVVGQREATKIPLVFYRTTAGIEPVRKWLKGLAPDERKAVGTDLMRAQWRWPIGMPHARPLGGGLHELRSNLPGGRTARLLFFAAGSQLIIVVGFIKETRATPRMEIDLAQARKQAWEQRDRRGWEEDADGE